MKEGELSLLLLENIQLKKCPGCPDNEERLCLKKLICWWKWFTKIEKIGDIRSKEIWLIPEEDFRRIWFIQALVGFCLMEILVDEIRLGELMILL